MIRLTMATFPERSPETNDFLLKSLALINEQDAENAYRRGEFYRKTGYPTAAELCYGEVKARWPKSRWAGPAAEGLEIVSRAPRREILPSQIMTKPGDPDPSSVGNTAGSLGSNPGGGGLGGGP